MAKLPAMPQTTTSKISKIVSGRFLPSLIRPSEDKENVKVMVKKMKKTV